MSASEPEFLAAELKKLVGWGASPRLLPKLHILRALAEAEREPWARAGAKMRRYLVRSIHSVGGGSWSTPGQDTEYELYGQRLSADKLRRAYLLLFQIEGYGLLAPDRRDRAIATLGVPIAVDSWRRPYGAEWMLLLYLAETMLPEPNQMTA